MLYLSEILLSNEKSGITFAGYVRRAGRVTVPKELREAYDIDEGDLVWCQIKKIR